MAQEGVQVVRVREDDAPLWGGFVASAEGAEIGHWFEYTQILTRVYGQETIPLAAMRGGSVVAVLPLVLQRSFFGTFLTSVPYLNYAGILGSDREGRDALAREALEIAKALRADRLELRGRDGSDLPLDAWSGKASYQLPLEGGAEGVVKALGTKLRNKAKRPLKDGFTARVGSGGEGENAAFYRVLARKWHELGSPILPRRYFEELGRMMGRDLVYVFVEREGELAAAGLLVRAGSVVEIGWAASVRKFDRYRVNMLLYLTAIEHAAATGATVFDFGRSTPKTTHAEFKLQWGAHETPLAWNVVALSGRGRASERGDDRRSLAAATWRRLPRFVASRLGPHLAARLPF
jgi:FemAB-related protein (PEP-CTERM system-associated)